MVWGEAEAQHAESWSMRRSWEFILSVMENNEEFSNRGVP